MALVNGDAFISGLFAVMQKLRFFSSRINTSAYSGSALSPDKAHSAIWVSSKIFTMHRQKKGELLRYYLDHYFLEPKKALWQFQFDVLQGLVSNESFLQPACLPRNNHFIFVPIFQ